nr:hypothetical protein [uncultured Sphingomonas sp.]
MSVSYQPQSSSWAARIAWFLLFLIVGAALAIWGLSRWPQAARFFGVEPKPPLEIVQRPRQVAAIAPPAPQTAADESRIAAIEQRLSKMEGQAQAAAGSAGRADALLVAFAARRAVDRGVALGYLEPLLVQRFGAQNQATVATVVTAARNPVKLDELIQQYEQLGPSLKGAGPDESWWSSFKREVGGVVSIHRADAPSPQPQARYDRALTHLRAGEVDAALAETMRMPGAANAEPWVAKARAYIAAHRALDQLESAALLGAGQAEPPTTISVDAAR